MLASDSQETYNKDHFSLREVTVFKKFSIQVFVGGESSLEWSARYSQDIFLVKSVFFSDTHTIFLSGNECTVSEQKLVFDGADSKASSIVNSSEVYLSIHLKYVDVITKGCT